MLAFTEHDITANPVYVLEGSDGPAGMYRLLDTPPRGTLRISGSTRPRSGQACDEVFAYFADSRDRATGAFQMHRRDVLAGEGPRPAQTDGTASVSGAQQAWSTVGLYDIHDNALTSGTKLLISQDREARGDAGGERSTEHDGCDRGAASARYQRLLVVDVVAST